MAKVAVVVTVLNEIKDIKLLVSSLIKQTKEIKIAVPYENFSLGPESFY